MNEQDQRVREFYENLSMPQERLDSLLSSDVVKSGPSSRFSLVRRIGELVGERSKRYAELVSNRHRRWDAALGVGVACAALLMVSLWVGNGSAELQHTQRTVREVAMNHTTRLNPEFRGDTLAMLDNSMQQLPFNLTLPGSIDDAFELIGSRYCSLSGELAAHVKLKHTQSGKAVSLFVTSNGMALKDVRTQQTSLEGVDVDLWREGGLFFALAQRS